MASGAALLAAGANTSPAHARWAIFSVSQTGVFAYRRAGPAGAAAAAGVDEQRTLFWVDRAGVRSQPIGTPVTFAGIDLSPDGKRVAVHRHEGTGGDIWFFDAAQPRMLRLTFNVSQENTSPVWSPDGTQVAFASQRGGKWGVYIKRADGSASEELITQSDIPAMPSSWSPDGKLLVYTLTPSAAQADIWAVPVAGERKPFPLLQAPQYPEAFGQVSPDGKWLSYLSLETGRTEIYVKPFPDGPGKWQVSVDGGTFPRWRGDSRELFFYNNNNLYAADIRVSGSSLEPGAPGALFQLPGPSAGLPHPAYNRYAVSADGQRFLLSQPGASAIVGGGLSDVIIAQVDRGGATANTGATPNAVSVVLNWQQLLKAK